MCFNKPKILNSYVVSGGLDVRLTGGALSDATHYYCLEPSGFLRPLIAN
jgi:hypothetical protein